MIVYGLITSTNAVCSCLTVRQIHLILANNAINS